ncbi:hypothetical protein [Ferrimonas pelagia]|uniref:Dienelactone hydrolase n=1 Tax=Ferrimonas pelagia TaxID=1177826 RepID=A0ABP9E9D8_9GAMM
MSDTLLLITDIWGQHASFDPFIAELNLRFGSVQVLDPYAGQRFAFRDEAQAYEYFQRRCSPAVYQQKLQALIEQAPSGSALLAFSAGANAAWPLLSTPLGQHLGKVALIYGSQIANDSERRPLCPTRLLLCRDDPGVTEPTTALIQHSQLTLTAQPHGFCNPRSPNHRAEPAQQLLGPILNWLAQPNA